MEPLKAEMTLEEIAEMEALAKGVNWKDDFRHGFRMGFAVGKLSALNWFTNQSILLQDDTTTGSQGKPTGGRPERVEAEGKKRNAGTVHRVRKNKAGDR